MVAVVDAVDVLLHVVDGVRVAVQVQLKVHVQAVATTVWEVVPIDVFHLVQTVVPRVRAVLEAVQDVTVVQGHVLVDVREHVQVDVQVHALDVVDVVAVVVVDAVQHVEVVVLEDVLAVQVVLLAIQVARMAVEGVQVVAQALALAVVGVVLVVIVAVVTVVEALAPLLVMHLVQVSYLVLLNNNKILN